MSVRRLSKTFISGAGAAAEKSSNFLAGYSPAIDEMDLIERVSLSASAASITFSNIPQTYQHLQIRGVSRFTVASSSTFGITVRFNDDTDSNYAWHVLFGNGSSAAAGGAASQTFGSIGQCPGGSATASSFGVSVIDILDYASTNKTTVARGFSGYDGNDTNGIVVIRSSLWNSTNAVNSILLYNNSGYVFSEYSSFSLYGVKA